MKGVFIGSFFIRVLQGTSSLAHHALQQDIFLSHCSLFGFFSQPTVFFSHTVLAPAFSHQPANNMFLSHHSSTSHQHQHSEQSYKSFTSSYVHAKQHLANHSAQQIKRKTGLKPQQQSIFPQQPNYLLS